MSRPSGILWIAALLVLSALGCTQKELKTSSTTVMQLTSSTFLNNGSIPSNYTCDGKDINPPLTLSDVPPSTQSLALIVDDPDAPGGDFVHWLVWNIPAATTSIAEESVPASAVEGMTGFGKTGWGGPCPPSGTHRYQFTLYALDGMLDLSAGATKAELLMAMSGHILEQTLLVGLYQRR
ncbi:MAG: YbhB/YbcL family Raf kinase inhibitor-like protein [Candidatus Kerfeldbacteria bacterium]|nr:YbhB/YbcL family Raf kinase inhibitor-like protein [Candidatus Kerfeldbacteria bacterium]